eukprot:13336165-Alexandrium_andersonii.AAC.1
MALSKAAPPVEPSGPRRSSPPGLRWLDATSTVLPSLRRGSLGPPRRPLLSVVVLGPGLSSTSPSSVRSLTHALRGSDPGRTIWARTTATALRVQYLYPWSALWPSRTLSLVPAQLIRSWESSAGLKCASSR